MSHIVNFITALCCRLLTWHSDVGGCHTVSIDVVSLKGVQACQSACEQCAPCPQSSSNRCISVLNFAIINDICSDFE